MQARAPALIVVIAVGLRLAYGPGHLGYDAIWALEWGREALSGSLPDYTAPLAPTPHPLANAFSLVLAPLGRTGAMTAVMALSWLSLAALAVLGLLLGRRLYSVWVGAAFAVILLTRHLLIRETHQAVVDIPFLALVVGALLLEVERPRRRLAVPVLLCAAGLLRPEGWLLGFAWVAYAAPGRPRTEVLRWIAVAAAAPLLWALSDLVITGDPLYSLHGTQLLAERLERPRAFGTALSAAPSYLRDALGDPLLWLGLPGAAAGLLGLYERTLLPAALGALGIIGFLALGVADLPLLVRYLLVPAVILALFCGLLLCGWTVVPRTDRAWRGWVAGAIVYLVVLAAFVPRQARALKRERGERRGDGRGAGRPAPDRGGPGLPLRGGALQHRLGARRAAAAAARLLAEAIPARDQDGRRVGGPAPRQGSCSSTPSRSRRGPSASPPHPPPAGRFALPAGGRHVAGNASWLVVEGC